jgi:hypothetical protein
MTVRRAQVKSLLRRAPETFNQIRRPSLQMLMTEAKRQMLSPAPSLSTIESGCESDHCA